MDLIYSDVTIEGLCEETNSVTRTWIATDDCGNSASCSATIIVEANQNIVVFNCPSDTLVACENEVPAIDISLVEVSGNCGAITVTHLSDVISNQTCLNSYTLTRTYQGTDICGNISTCSQIITVRDIIAPIITCPTVISPVECNTVISFGIATATDACEASVEVTYSDVSVEGLCAQEYSVTRTWTATDDCGNTATCSRTIQVQDTRAPIIACPVVESPVPCGTAILFPTATTLDACDNAVELSFTDVTVQGACAQEYSVTRTWTATDDCGNSTTHTATIVVQDNTAPVIVCLVVESPIECGEQVSFGIATATDACDGLVELSYSDVLGGGSCAQDYSVTRTWIAIDECGNSSTCSATIQVQDNTAPVIVCPIVESPIPCGETPVFGEPTVSDLCDISVDVVFSDVTIEGSCEETNSVTRTWIATDDCGNSASCSATIIVEANQNIVVFNCPSDTLVACENEIPAIDISLVEASGNCGTITVTHLSDVISNQTCLNTYTLTRTYQGTDICGNVSTCSQIITVRDITAPVITCPSVISPIDCGSEVSFGVASATDGCEVSVEISYSDVSVEGSCSGEYSVTRTWIATDNCGNSASCSRTIAVQDTTAPVIICPEVVSPIYCPTLPVFPDAIATDACDSSVTITFVDVTEPGLWPQEYSEVRTWTATDDCGNTATCSATITILDSTAPVITCPTVISPIECGSEVSFGIATAIDACDLDVDVTFSDSTVQGACPQSYSVIRTWIAMDNTMNSSTCSRTIEVQDTGVPVIVCPIVESPIPCGETPVFGTPTVSDACDTAVDVVFSDVTIEGLCEESNSVTRTWIATDDCGNTASCSATIIVEGNQNLEVFTCPSDTLVECANDVPAIDISLVGASGDCGTIIVTHLSDVISNQTCPNTYTSTRTYQGIDTCGQVTTCSQIITVRDIVAPVITCATVLSPIECGTDISFGVPSATDECGVSVEISFSDVSVEGTCSGEYSVTRTWLATDDCGNTATCSSTITVQDTTAPILTCTTEVSLIECGTEVSFDIATAIDACDTDVEVSFSDVTIEGDCAEAYSVTRTWVATDDCGNTATCSSTITVQDTTAPIIICPIVESPIECGETPLFGDVTVSDACDTGVDVVFSDVTIEGLCEETNSVTRTWIATDNCGNTASCSATIIVEASLGLLSITCMEDTLVGCVGDVPAIDISLIEVSGDCGSIVVTHLNDVISDQSCSNNYTLIRTYQASGCGLIATCSQNITVSDTISPELVFPSTLPYVSGDTMLTQCYGQNPEWDIPSFDAESIIAVDNCSDNVIITYDVSLEDEGDCSTEGYINLYRMEWTATDSCGNSSSAHLFLSLVDSIPPVIEGVPADITVTCENVPAPLTLYATDECLCACVVLFQESVLDSSTCLNGQVMVRTWTARDRCGNETIETQRITMIDEVGPIVHMIHPELLEFTNDSVYEYSCTEGGIPAFFDLMDSSAVSGIGACDSNAIITFTENSTIQTNCEFFGYIEQREYSWTATDPCGNTSVMNITVRLLDDEAPVILGLPEMACFGDQLNDVEVYDNCDHASLRFWNVNIPNPCGEGIAQRRTYEAYDRCGNITVDTVIILPRTESVPFMVFVDQEMALLDSSIVLSMNCEAIGDRYTTFGVDDVRVEGVCVAGTTIEFKETTLSTNDCNSGASMATVELRWTATDVCGSSAEKIIIAEIYDDTAPAFVNFTSEISIGCNDSIPESHATDNCGEVVMTYADTILQGECAYEYDIERRITATDRCGNFTTRRQTIHVGNEDGPVITGVQAHVCDDLSMPEVAAYDECAEQYVTVTMRQDTLEDVCRDGLLIQRTWSATDACGNIAEILQTIVMNDQTPPEIVYPSYSVLSYFMEVDSAVVYHSENGLFAKLNAIDLDFVSVTDDCYEEIIPVFTVDTLFGADCVEHRTYTWIATDICNNADTLSFTVGIIDDIIPEFVEIIGDSMISCAPLPPPTSMVMVDTLENVTIVYYELQEPGSVPGQIIVTRTWVATDSCQNSTTYVQQIIWSESSALECAIILPEVVDCNSHGVVITSEIRGGVGLYTYEWEVVGEKCFIQSGQNTPEILIYVGWSDVTIILTVTDSLGCVTVCEVSLDCNDITNIPLSSSFGDVFPETVEGQTLFSAPLVIPNGEQTDHLENLSFYPNPADEVINIAFESAFDGSVNILFTDYLGKVMLTESMIVHKGHNVQQMDASRLANGSYMVHIQSEKAQYTRGVIVLHLD